MDYPYKGTAVSVEISQGHINALLQKYHIKGVQWSTVWSTGDVELKFPLEIEADGIKKTMLVRLKPPLFYSEHRSYDPRKGYVKVRAPDYKASMRALFFYLKAMMEAQAYGLAKKEDIFMSYIMVTLPGGTLGTLGDLMRSKMVTGELPALEQAPEEAVQS